jgi:beta propeller repeat protein
MKKLLVFLGLATLILSSIICVRVFAYKEKKYKEQLVFEQYYNISGLEARVYGQKLVVYDKDLKIIDLVTKKVIKEIEVPGKEVLGFDIFEDKLLWADLRNEKDEEKKKGLMEKANSDIFLYDISKDEMQQITTDKAAQTRPVIWGKYIAWQDNRDDELEDGYPQWNIYLYDMENKSELRVTKERGIHTNCKLFDGKLIWEDGRNFTGLQTVRLNSDMPINNTDIYMYIIDQDRHISIANGVYKDCNADIWKDYVVWECQEELKHNAEVMLYNLKSMDTQNITEDSYGQKEPAVSDDLIVWIDEKNGIENFDSIEKQRNGKSDIGVYDMKSSEKVLIEEEGAQTLCSVTPEYIVYSSRQDEKTSEIKVMKYYRKQLQ